MICPKCKTKNIKKANFCMKCKHEFSDEDREKVYKKTIFHFFDIIESIYYHLNLEIVTSNIFYQIGSLLLVLGIGIYFYFTYGISTTFLSSKEYATLYNKKSNEYYIVTDNEKIANLRLYFPNRLKKVELKEYDSNNKKISTKKIKKKKSIPLDITIDSYYILKSTYSNKKTEELKFYVYKKSDIENK